MCIIPAASGATEFFFIVQALDSSGPEVKKVLSFLDDIKIEPISKISKMKKTKHVNWDNLQSNQRALNIKDKLSNIRS